MMQLTPFTWGKGFRFAVAKEEYWTEGGVASDNAGDEESGNF